MALTTKRDSPKANRILVYDGDLQVGTIIRQGPKTYWWISKHTGGYAESEYKALEGIKETL